MGLNNAAVEEHMNALFGSQRADQLRQRLQTLSPQVRELTIVEELSQALRNHGSRHVLPFRFMNDNGNRTSHHLIFVSKHFKGYEIMKGIMARESSSSSQGVASFEYNPADRRQPLLFELTRPIDDLAESLMSTFSGKTLSMREVYEQHNVGTPYIDKNYKEVLLKLEEEGRITTNPSQRRKNTFGDTVMVTFP
jgi:hypothetical protein